MSTFSSNRTSPQRTDASGYRAYAFGILLALPMLLGQATLAYGSCGDWLAHGPTTNSDSVITKVELVSGISRLFDLSIPAPCQGPHCDSGSPVTMPPLAVNRAPTSKVVGTLTVVAETLRDESTERSNLLPQQNALPGHLCRIDRPPTS
ncbi:hypothetical protein NHH03_19075 [Stieleria sp. TO1_6]|uniref:hypothetical protein n=1 Tax=Stieleria tagensis TaxID=2956795 RepID=UPI00209B1BD2|nr:hypothetical protein [Stieleria tagensis]MCO8123856.1 hypothetical protein [Stieleria tagensis]